MTIPRDLVLESLDICIRRLELKARLAELEHSRRLALSDYNQSTSNIAKIKASSAFDDGMTGGASASSSSDSFSKRLDRFLYKGLMPTDEEIAAAGSADAGQRRRMMSEAQVGYEKGRARDLERMTSISEQAKQQIRQYDQKIADTEEQIRNAELQIMDLGVVPYRFWGQAKPLKQAMTESDPALTLYDAVMRIGAQNA